MKRKDLLEEQFKEFRLSSKTKGIFRGYVPECQFTTLFKI